MLVQGSDGEKYRSRSEAEGALILSLINSGFDFHGIKRIFDNFPCFGHYSAMRKDKDRWLYMEYQTMLSYSQKESPARRAIRKIIEEAEKQPWKKESDKRVFIA